MDACAFSNRNNASLHQGRASVLLVASEPHARKTDHRVLVILDGEVEFGRNQTFEESMGKIEQTVGDRRPNSAEFQRLDAAGNDRQSLKRHRGTVIGP
jgi:hypothetical protein